MLAQMALLERANPMNHCLLWAVRQTAIRTYIVENMPSYGGVLEDVRSDEFQSDEWPTSAAHWMGE